MYQGNLQTMIMQKFWGVKEVYYGIVQVVNLSFIFNSQLTQTVHKINMHMHKNTPRSHYVICIRKTK